MTGWRSGPDPTLPFSTTWREFRDELPAHRWARLVAACDASWNGLLRDASATKAGEYDADFDSYLAQRRDGVFVEWIFPILEHVLAPALPEDLVTGPAMQEVHNRVLFHQALATDLFSYRKEYYSGDLINAIEVFQRIEGLSLQGAVDRLCDVIDRNEEEFLLGCEALLGNHPDWHDSLSGYLNALGSLMSAARHWSYTCRRYHGSGSAGDGSEPGTLLLWPDRTEFRPDAP
ncbi:terpene synthase family protein [Streptomyces sp. NPDC088350]|uniref:terpene synthase family protein n=1 Tax=Streptomyces sp. NPDC088350 TaxID=3365854 RepID=UPI00382C0638